MRWQMLIRLAASDQDDIAPLLAAESAKDDSDFALKYALSAAAAEPSAEQKAHWLQELEQPDQLTGLSRQRAVMSALFPATQTALQAQFLQQILESLPRLSHQVDPYFMSSYVRALLQPICQPQSVATMQRTLEDNVDALDNTALRYLREAIQADSECVALRSAQ